MYKAFENNFVLLSFFSEWLFCVMNTFEMKMLLFLLHFSDIQWVVHTLLQNFNLQLKLPIATDYLMNIVKFCFFLQKKLLFESTIQFEPPTSGLIISQQMNENSKHSWSIFRCNHFVYVIISIFEEWTQFDNCFCVTFWCCSSIFSFFLEELILREICFLPINMRSLLFFVLMQSANNSAVNWASSVGYGKKTEIRSNWTCQIQMLYGYDAGFIAQSIVEWIKNSGLSQ